MFGFDSATLSSQDKAALEAVARQFLASGSGRLKVTGYADERGVREYNLALSRRRAETVAQYLVASGVDAGQLTVEGGGIYSDVMQSGRDAPGRQNGQGRIVRLDWQTINRSN